MANIWKYNIGILSLIVISVVQGFAAPKEKIFKNIKKEFSISSTSMVSIENMYGAITFEEWTKNEVSFEIYVEVTAKDRETAEDKLKSIDVAFTKLSNGIHAKTLIESKNSTSWSGWFGSNKNTSYKIDYRVKCPKSVLLELTNKYGNVNIPAWVGKVNLTLSYGKGQIGNLAQYFNSTVSYGGLTMSDASEARITLKYSDLNIRKASKLSLSIAYSEANITEATTFSSVGNYSEIVLGSSSNVNLEGSYNDYELGSVSNLTKSGNYSHITATQLKGKCTISQTYGSFKATTLTNSNFTFSGKYTDVTLGTKDFSLSFSGSYAKPKLPSTATESVSKKTSTSYVCTAQNGNANNLITFTSSYGDLRLGN